LARNVVECMCSGRVCGVNDSACDRCRAAIEVNTKIIGADVGVGAVSSEVANGPSC
jgi:hypothetical protein